MSELERTWIEIFKAGDYGQKGAWSLGDLDRIAQSYNPELHAAPVVLGHPADDAPAYGWVKRLRRAGQSLWAQLTKIAPAFEELVRQGRFLQRSVALYKDFPLTGGPYLRHLGFLGAQVPEVKGLQPLMLFSGRYVGVVEFSDAPAEKAPTKTVTLPRFVASYRIPVDPASVELAEWAELLAAAENITYGEALRRARQKAASARVPQPSPPASMMGDLRVSATDSDAVILEKWAEFIRRFAKSEGLG